MRNVRRYINRRAMLVVVLVATASALGAIGNAYLSGAMDLSDHILVVAEELQVLTHDRVLDVTEAEATLDELRSLIDQYEANLIFAQSRYPGEILLGRTPPGHSRVVETLVSSRYDGMYKELRIRRTGRRTQYLRINDITLTGMTLRGPETVVMNERGRDKLYYGSVFRMALPKPMRLRRIQVKIDHESTGLEIYGVPYEMPTLPRRRPSRYGVYGRPDLPGRPSAPSRPHPPVIVEPTPPRPTPPHPPVVIEPAPSEVLLGTTPPGDSTWLETLCSTPYDYPIKEIRIRRTGKLASYLRINDIEITHMTRRGLETELLNEGARVKLYYDGNFRLALPRPMRITRIRIKIDHESAGLKVYGGL